MAAREVEFSVVIPLHNAAPYIGATLKSLAAQTVLPGEVVVVDDGSSDGGGDLARAFRFPDGSSPIVIRHETPTGVAVARNHGVFLARGTWVGLCDNDDLWHPRRIETVLTVAAEHAEYGAIATELVGFALENERQSLRGHQREVMVTYWVPDDRIETLAQFATEPILSRRLVTFEDFQQDPCMTSTTICFRRELYAMSGGCATWSPPLGDWILHAMVAAMTPVVVVEDPLVFYRVRASSQSHEDARLAQGALAILLALRYGDKPDKRPAGAIYRHMVGVGARNGFSVSKTLAFALLGGSSGAQTARLIKAAAGRRLNLAKRRLPWREAAKST